jgi:hypothetical protein
MRDILDDLPAQRSLSPARAHTLRANLEQFARRPAPRRKLFASARFLVPTTALVVSAVVAVVVITGTTLVSKPAYASWTPKPGALNSAEITAIGHECARSVQSIFPNASAGLRPVLGERRGTFQTALIADGGQVALCAAWLGTQDGGTVRGSNLSGLAVDAALAPGTALSSLATPGQLSGPEAARITFGLVSAEVAAVRVTTEDGREIEASVSGGYYLAWWPSGSGATLIEAFDAAGRSLAKEPGR